MFFVLAGLTVIDFAAVARHRGDETAVIILAGVFYGMAYLCAGLGVMRRRRWGWILGVLLGVQGSYAGEVYLRALSTPPHHPWTFVRPLLLTGGAGIVILVYLLTPAAIRFFWGRTTGKHPLAATMIPST